MLNGCKKVKDGQWSCSIVCTWVMGGRGGGLSHFSEGLYWRDLGQIGIFGRNEHFRWGLFFSGGTWKLPAIKIVNINLKQKKKKKDTNCNFNNFSLLVPYPNKFLVVCTCILIFHGMYSPLPWFFFVRG